MLVVVMALVPVDAPPARPPIATAAPAPPTTASPIHSHLWPPCGRRAEASLPAASDIGHTVPARASPFVAVMRTSKEPAVRFHCMPQTLARPSEPVVAISDFEELGNEPLAPSSGSWKVTETPLTGLPVSFVTSTVIPRVARDQI